MGSLFVAPCMAQNIRSLQASLKESIERQSYEGCGRGRERERESSEGQKKRGGGRKRMGIASIRLNLMSPVTGDRSSGA